MNLLKTIASVCITIGCLGVIGVITEWGDLAIMTGKTALIESIIFLMILGVGIAMVMLINRIYDIRIERRVLRRERRFFRQYGNI